MEKMPKKSMLMWDETLFRDPDVFEIDYIPDQFNYRENQMRELSFLLKPGIRGGRPLNAIIKGTPGRVHGALDLDAIRAVDLGEMTASDAFLKAGVEHTLPDNQQIPALAMFAAMECAALSLLAPEAPVALCGSLADTVRPGVTELLGKNVLVLDEWTAARGLAAIAEAVFSGCAPEILGIKVEL